MRLPAGNAGVAELTPDCHALSGNGGVELSAIDDAVESEEVVLIDRQGGGQISLAEVCATQGGTPSDIAMAIGPVVLRA